MKNLTKSFLGPLAENIIVTVHGGRSFYQALDITKLLGMSNITLAMKMLPRGEKTKIPMNTGVRMKKVWFISEEGIYFLILQSNCPVPKSMRNTIAQNMLPMLADRLEREQENTAQAHRAA